MNDFQQRCVARCVEAFGASAGKELSFKEVRGKKEEYFLADIDVKGRHLDIYVYEDEAGVKVDRDKWFIFEKPGFNSQDELIEAFVGKLRGLIAA